MILAKAPHIEPLADRHDRSAFHCGEPALDDYIRHRARQDLRRRVATVFVAVGEQSRVIAGYYTLSAASLDRGHLPEIQARKLPRYPVAAAIIGRLGVDENYQGRSYGRFILFDALDRTLRASASMAVPAALRGAQEGAGRAVEGQVGLPEAAGPPGGPVYSLEQVERLAFFL